MYVKLLDKLLVLHYYGEYSVSISYTVCSLETLELLCFFFFEERLELKYTQISCWPRVFIIFEQH